MLTKNDLQEIKKVIDISIDHRISPLEKKIDKLGGSLKWWVRKLQKNDDAILDYFEKDGLNIKRRVDRLERHAGLPPVVNLS